MNAAIKGGWARQISALAKSNDKVEKKTGVRLSKKERRVMVESFIKTFQKSNNGTFPSIKLTQKEVGGSYYIVREIVRDIIQENRVLAPPKEHKKEHKTFNSLPGDYPLGSISMEPPVSTASLPNGMHESDCGASTGEVILKSEELTDHSIDDNHSIGQNAPDGKLKEQFHEKLQATKSPFGTYQDLEKSKLEETVEQTEPPVGMVSNISTAVEVELFPFQDSMKLSESLTPSSQDAVNLNGTTERVIDQPDVDPISPIIRVEDQKAKPMKTTAEQGLDKISESSSGKFNNFYDKEGIGADATGSDGQKGIVSHSGGATAVVEQGQELTSSEPAAIASNTATVKKSDEKGTTEAKYEAFHSSIDVTSHSIVKSSSEQDATEAKIEAVKSSTGNHKDSKPPTLDRMNLESWEKATKKPVQEGSPFSAFVKACVSAFSKLWSK
ncbi:unnamed protein product [Rhodiola kirilowii]